MYSRSLRQMSKGTEKDPRSSYEPRVRLPFLSLFIPFVLQVCLSVPPKSVWVFSLQEVNHPGIPRATLKQSARLLLLRLMPQLMITETKCLKTYNTTEGNRAGGRGWENAGVG